MLVLHAGRVASGGVSRPVAYTADMHASELDHDAVAVLRALGAADVQFVVLEDEDPVAVTLVAGPAARNLDRLVKALRKLGATVDGTDGRRPDVRELRRTAPARWPLRIGRTTIDLVRVGVDDGRWSGYFDQATTVELDGGLRVDVVPDQPIVAARRADAFTAMPELALTRRERERARRERREHERREERRAARRRTVARLTRRA